MKQRTFQTILLCFCLWPALTIFGRQADTGCTGFSAPYIAFIDGYADSASLSKEAILTAGQLVSSYPAFKVVSFHMGTTTGCIYQSTKCHSSQFNEKVIYLMKQTIARRLLII